MNRVENLWIILIISSCNIFCSSVPPQKIHPYWWLPTVKYFAFCGITTRVRYPISVRRYISFSRYESSVLNKFRYLAATNSVTKVLYYLQSSYLCRASFRFIDSSLSFPCIPCSFVYLYLEIGKQILNEFLCNKTQTTRCSIMSKIIS